MIKNDKECKLVFGPSKALFFTETSNQFKKLKDLPHYKIIECNVLKVDEKHFVDKAWYFTLVLVLIIIIAGIVAIYLNMKGCNIFNYFLIFGIILIFISCYKMKILESFYYKKIIKNYKQE